MATENGVEEEVKEKKNDFLQKSIVEINNDNNGKHQPNAIQYKTLCFIFTMSNWFVFIRIEYTVYSIQYTELYTILTIPAYICRLNKIVFGFIYRTSIYITYPCYAMYIIIIFFVCINLFGFECKCDICWYVIWLQRIKHSFCVCYSLTLVCKLFTMNQNRITWNEWIEEKKHTYIK